MKDEAQLHILLSLITFGILLLQRIDLKPISLPDWFTRFRLQGKSFFYHWFAHLRPSGRSFAFPV
ncbi:MAG: hypothetical protein IPL28_22770 [Chloroflexi bacterium]|nr:hypothetical protein [Chloroflexota bacterium]